MTVATYPAYDATDDASTWELSYLTNDNIGVLFGMANTGVGWYVKTNHLNLAPGKYLLSEFRAAVAYTSDTECDALYFVLLESADHVTAAPVTLGNGAQYIDITSDKGEDASHTITADLGNVAVTLEAGKYYYWGIAMRGTVGRTTSRPAQYCMKDGHGPQGDQFWIKTSTADFPTSGFNYFDGASGREPCKYSLKVKTANRIVYQGAYAAAQVVGVPRRTDGDYWIKFENANVADGEALTVALDIEDGGEQSTVTTMVLDFGATDQVTFAGQNVALNAGTPEAGNDIDIGLNFRPTTGKADLFYENMEVGQGFFGANDFQTWSHATRVNSARGKDYAVAAPSILDMSGTAAVETIYIGWEPVVILGDSQAVNDNTKYGGLLPSSFTYPRIAWHSAMGASKFYQSATSSTAGYLRYKHTTAGNGDLCEMTGIVFVFAGFGINDLQEIGTDETARNKIVAIMLSRLTTLLDDLQDNANAALLIGLPPYSKAGSASEQEAQTVKNQWNVGLEGLAIAMRCAYLNPWWDMVDRATANNAIPTFAAAYTSDAGAHYNATGCQIVCDLAVQAFESNRVGGPWVKRNTRGRYPGLLLPL